MRTPPVPARSRLPEPWTTTRCCACWPASNAPTRTRSARCTEPFRGDSQFSTWLIGIARNKVLMAFRGRKPDSRHEDLESIAEVLPAEGGSAFDAVAEAQRREGVLHCMDKLSDEHRECVHLVFYEGLALAEVAEVQGCPENTVKTRLFHARQKLKNCLRLLVQREGGSLAGAST
jgi:RNA polymerase sigma-70 factor (ECF subfamily)